MSQATAIVGSSVDSCCRCLAAPCVRKASLSRSCEAPIAVWCEATKPHTRCAACLQRGRLDLRRVEPQQPATHRDTSSNSSSVSTRISIGFLKHFWQPHHTSRRSPPSSAALRSRCLIDSPPAPRPPPASLRAAACRQSGASAHGGRPRPSPASPARRPQFGSLAPGRGRTCRARG